MRGRRWENWPAEIRRRLQSKVIAVAGSNGKTGTKLLIDAALREQLHGTYSPKSFNNDIGVPLAIFPAEPVQDYLILEIGTNHPGEIRNLTHIAQPYIAVITNCIDEQQEALGDLSGVRRENASIIEGLKPDGLLIVNGDDAELLKSRARLPREAQDHSVWVRPTIFLPRIFPAVRMEPDFISMAVTPACSCRCWASIPRLNALAAIAVGRASWIKRRGNSRRPATCDKPGDAAATARCRRRADSQ